MDTAASGAHLQRPAQARGEVSTTLERCSGPAMDPDAARVRVLEQSLGIPFQRGNRVRALRNGKEIFPAMLEAIEGACESIAFITFVYWTGDIAMKFASALAGAARRGVTVMVLLDAVGARPMDKKLLHKMEEAGVQVRWFRPLGTWRVWRWSHRTHRKVLIVDHEVGFTGGVGIAKEWEGDARDETQWRDTHFEIRGPAVEALWGSFVGNWMETLHTLPRHWSRPIALKEAGTAEVQLVRASASIGWSDVVTAVFALVSLAQRRLRIATAYFVPDADLVELLADKARSGVDVDLLLPGPHHDHRMVKLAGQKKMRALLAAGVKIHRFQPSMMHAKIILVDDQLAMIGSANLNYRSLRKDDEIVLTVSDRQLVSELDHDFDQDLSRSKRLTEEQLANRPWWRKALSTFFYRFRYEF